MTIKELSDLYNIPIQKLLKYKRRGLPIKKSTSTTMMLECNNWLYANHKGFDVWNFTQGDLELKIINRSVT